MIINIRIIMPTNQKKQIIDLDQYLNQKINILKQNFNKMKQTNITYCNNLIRSRCDCKQKPDSFDRKIGSAVKLLIQIATKMHLLVYSK